MSCVSFLKFLNLRLNQHGLNLRSCLALMDAGVPIKAPVAGIAMGLILEAIVLPSSRTFKVLKTSSATWISKSQVHEKALRPANGHQIEASHSIS